MSIPDLFQAGSKFLVETASDGGTVRLRRYSEGYDNVARTTTRTLAFEADIAAFPYDDSGRRSKGSGRMLMIAAGVSAAFDAQPALGGDWTIDEGDGREIPLDGGVKGLRPNGHKVSYWLAQLKESTPGAGEGAT